MTRHEPGTILETDPGFLVCDTSTRDRDFRPRKTGITRFHYMHLRQKAGPSWCGSWILDLGSSLFRPARSINTYLSFSDLLSLRHIIQCHAMPCHTTSHHTTPHHILAPCQNRSTVPFLPLSQLSSPNSSLLPLARLG